MEVIPAIARLGFKRALYISCNPGSLAREHGYRLAKTGVMDMFPHTAHVGSIAVFEKTK